MKFSRFAKTLNLAHFTGAVALGASVATYTHFKLQDSTVFAEKKPNMLFSWGQGIKGQLGIGVVQFGAPSPTRLETLEDFDIQHIAAKSDISAAITSEGELWTWGSVRNGSMLTAQGEVYNRNLDEPALFDMEGKKFRYCAVGKDHVAMITSDGLLMTMGSKDHGKLGHAPEEKKQLSNIEKQRYQRVNTNSSAALGPVAGELGSKNVVQVACGF